MKSLNTQRQNGILKSTELFRPVVKSMAMRDHQVYIETHAGSAASCIGRKPCAQRSIALVAPDEYSRLRSLIEAVTPGTAVKNDDPAMFLENFNWSSLEGRRALIFSSLPENMEIDALVSLLSIYRMLSRRDNIDIIVTAQSPSALHDDMLGDWDSHDFMIESATRYKLWTNFDAVDSSSILAREPLQPNLSFRAQRIVSCLMKLPSNEQDAVANALFSKAKHC